MYFGPKMGDIDLLVVDVYFSVLFIYDLIVPFNMFNI